MSYLGQKTKLNILLLTVFIFPLASHSLENNSTKVEFCKEIDKCEVHWEKVCGIRKNGTLFQLRLFDNECELLKFGCQVQNREEEYGIIDTKYCKNAPKISETIENETKTKCSERNCSEEISDGPICAITEHGEGFKLRLFVNECTLDVYNCQKNATFRVTDLYLCDGIETARESNRRSAQINRDVNVLKHSQRSSKKNDPDVTNDFETNNMENVSYVENIETTKQSMHTKDKSKAVISRETEKVAKSSENSVAVTQTKLSLQNNKNYSERALKNIQNSSETENDLASNITEKPVTKTESAKYESPDPLKLNTPQLPKKVTIVLDGDMFNFNGNVNETLANFIEATNAFGMPLMPVLPKNETTRRMLMKIFGPVVVYKPWVQIPKVIETDIHHQPTLISCYHRCPSTCPDTYAPVCGVPGSIAREPALMFKNHCLMDMTQCKMRWENASPTAESSGYVEAGIVACVGDTLNTMYKFLPLIRTLQHMGRLKKKGTFHYKFRNMRFFNELYRGVQPRPMG